MNTLLTHELKERIISGREHVLIAFRTAGVFAGAHLHFAVSVPLDNLELLFD